MFMWVEHVPITRLKYASKQSANISCRCLTQTVISTIPHILSTQTTQLLIVSVRHKCCRSQYHVSLLNVFLHGKQYVQSRYISPPYERSSLTTIVRAPYKLYCPCQSFRLTLCACSQTMDRWMITRFLPCVLNYGND